VTIDAYSLKNKLEADFSDSYFANAPSWYKTSGGVYLEFTFENQLFLSHSQASIQVVIIEVGSALSIMYAAYLLIRFFLGIKYRNWLGSYLKELHSSPSTPAQEQASAASPRG